MHKPITTTIGDALAAKSGDWRFQLRAEDIPRRPPKEPSVSPPSSRPDSQLGPDQGYVEQPEERIETTIAPPLVMVRRRPEPEPPAEPTVAPPPATEAAEMPKAKKTTGPRSVAFKDEVVAYALRDGQPGAQARAAKKFKTTQASVSTWMKKANGAAQSTKTLISRVHLPASGPVSTRGPLPPLPTISIPGLQEYIQALVAVEVAAQLKRRLSGIMSDD